MTEMISKRKKNNESKKTENGRGNDGESKGRMVLGQKGRHTRGGSKNK